MAWQSPIFLWGFFFSPIGEKKNSAILISPKSPDFQPAFACFACLFFLSCPSSQPAWPRFPPHPPPDLLRAVPPPPQHPGAQGLPALQTRLPTGPPGPTSITAARWPHSPSSVAPKEARVQLVPGHITVPPPHPRARQNVGSCVPRGGRLISAPLDSVSSFPS